MATIIHDAVSSLLETNIYYVVKTDMEGKYSFMNGNFAKKFGLDPIKSLGINSLGSILPVDHQVCIETVQKCIEEPEKGFLVWLRKPSPNGVVTNQWEFKGLLNESGSLSEILCIGYEVTELIKQRDEIHRLLAQLSSKNIRLQTLLEIMVHDFKGPLGSMSGLLNLIDLNEKEEAQEFLSSIQQAVGHLEEKILNINEGLKGDIKAPLEFSEIDFENFLQKILKFFASQIKQHGISIHLNNSLSKILTNSFYLESIVYNIISNAIKYRNPDRDCYIEISCHEDSVFYYINISDNGIGIDLEAYGKYLFMPYVVVANTSQSNGLGLHITKNQVDQLGGGINVSSKLGSGTSIELKFPREQYQN